MQMLGSMTGWRDRARWRPSRSCSLRVAASLRARRRRLESCDPRSRPTTAREPKAMSNVDWSIILGATSGSPPFASVVLVVKPPFAGKAYIFAIPEMPPKSAHLLRSLS